jgi:F0F1-type ATP synthase beta subunit
MTLQIRRLFIPFPIYRHQLYSLASEQVRDFIWRQTLANYEELKDIIAMLGLEELSPA